MGLPRQVPMKDDLGFEAIKAVPAGGHFFGAEHTMSRYETAFYRPMLSNWQNYGSWQEAGSHDALERATGLWQRALRDYDEPAMDPAIRKSWTPIRCAPARKSQAANVVKNARRPILS